MIKKKTASKDLGIEIVDDMKWNILANNAASKVLRVLFMLKRSSTLLKPKTKLKLFKSMKFPVKIYGSPCWYHYVEPLKVPENVQKKCVKWINSGFCFCPPHRNRS